MTPLCRNGHPRIEENLDCRNRCRTCVRERLARTGPVRSFCRGEVVAKTRGLQLLTRIPPVRKGDRIQLRTNGATPPDLRGKVVTVRSLTCAIVDREKVAWRIVLEDGRCVRWGWVERLVDDGRAGEKR